MPLIETALITWFPPKAGVMLNSVTGGDLWTAREDSTCVNTALLNLALCPAPAVEAEAASKFAQNPLQGQVGLVVPCIRWVSLWGLKGITLNVDQLYTESQVTRGFLYYLGLSEKCLCLGSFVL